jgi:Uma2 family endonuclease
MAIAYNTLKEVRSIVALLMQRPITEEIVLKIAEIEGYEHLEIKNGEWVGLDREWEDMTTGEEHGWIESLLMILIGGFVLKNKLGRVYPGDVVFVLDGTPKNIRHKVEPDFAFVATENVRPSKGFIYQAPDFAIEIKSPSQNDEEMRAKAAEYLQYGTKQVWLVFPDKKQIEVHLPNAAPKVYGVGEMISAGDLLAGFTLDVAVVFEGG